MIQLQQHDRLGCHTGLREADDNNGPSAPRQKPEIPLPIQRIFAVGMESSDNVSTEERSGKGGWNARKRAIKSATSARLTKKVLVFHRDELPFEMVFVRLSRVARTFTNRYTCRPEVAPKCTSTSTLARPRDEVNSKTDTNHCFNPPDWTMACQTTSSLWKLPRKCRVLGNSKQHHRTHSSHLLKT